MSHEKKLKMIISFNTCKTKLRASCSTFVKTTGHKAEIKDILVINKAYHNYLIILK